MGTRRQRVKVRGMQGDAASVGQRDQACLLKCWRHQYAYYWPINTLKSPQKLLNKIIATCNRSLDLCKVHICSSRMKSIIDLKPNS